MPELPEVENVKLNLQALGVVNQRIKAVDLRRKDLRTPLKKELKMLLPGQIIRHLERRAKYLVFETDDHLLLSHLGMTGSWRVGSSADTEYEKHDHVVLSFESGLKLIFNDPRRFGIFELASKAKPNRWLKHLGLEPLSSEFHAERLFEITRAVKAPIKSVLMDQRRVVGVGNIYASEALFAAGVKPTRVAGRVTRAECELLVRRIREILRKAIQAGGSTIRDYRQVNGESGRYQNAFAVYNREGQACVRCGEEGRIRSKVIAGRNTFWCPRCQR